MNEISKIYFLLKKKAFEYLLEDRKSACRKVDMHSCRSQLHARYSPYVLFATLSSVF